MELAVHLPQLDFGLGPPVDARRLAAVVDTAREAGFAAVCANDHLAFPRPWVDGLAMLAAAAPRAGAMDVMTTVGLPALRGPTAFAASVEAIAALCEGRVVAGVGPGSSRADYDAAGVPWDQRWQRFDAAVQTLRQRFGPDLPAGGRRVELWLASWGSPAGLRRAARQGDGWLASAYRGTPESFGAALRSVAAMVRGEGRDPAAFGHAVVTMWLWIDDDRAAAARVLDRVAGALGADPETLAARACVGSPARCAELLAGYADQGCRRVAVWPVADEPAQLARLAADVLPQLRP